MIIVKVVKPLVSTNRIPDFEHKHLQVVQDGSSKKVLQSMEPDTSEAATDVAELAEVSTHRRSHKKNRPLFFN